MLINLIFTDIHAHIINKIDDGCNTVEESLYLIQKAIENNVGNIFLTPHFDSENPDVINMNIVLKQIDYLNKLIKQSNLEIKLFPGMEVRISSRLIGLLGNKNYRLTLGDRNKYILIESPFIKLPPNFEDIIFKIRLSGLIPILAHPERNSEVRDNPELLRKPWDEGMLIQIDNSSIVNKKNSLSYKTAISMLKMEMVDFIASDCHYAEGRYSNFLEAFKILSRIVGSQKAKLIAIDNPEKILNNEDFKD